MGEASVSPASENSASRPEISIYWQPGCSSCVKAKEFVAEQGYEFESVNVLKNPAAMQEIMAAGLRSIPVIRKGDKFIYAQSLDDIANFLDVTRNHVKLSQEVLVGRWDDILEKAEAIIQAFDESMLQRHVIPHRERVVRDLSAHVFQIVESFMRQIEDDTIDARAIYLDPREDIKTRNDLLSYVSKTHQEYRDWRKQGGMGAIPARMNTYYGNQPSSQVLERGVWHSAQHARQLDFVAAGMGAELRIPQELYEGLPMPKRLWA